MSLRMRREVKNQVSKNLERGSGNVVEFTIEKGSKNFHLLYEGSNI